MPHANASHELARDLEWLDRAESDAFADFRVWTEPEPTVVIGRSVDPDDEVDQVFCAQNGIDVIVRPSGGRSVLIGPGTLQYTFALPVRFDPALADIGGCKRVCNALLRDASPTLAALDEDPSGDLVRDGRKVAGLSLRRRRGAMMLHGTILLDADLALVARALKHPTREPAYRRGRAHADFIDNLGPLDTESLVVGVRDRIARRMSG